MQFRVLFLDKSVVVSSIFKIRLEILEQKVRGKHKIMSLSDKYSEEIYISKGVRKGELDYPIRLFSY